MIARATLAATLSLAVPAVAAAPVHVTPDRVGRVHLGDTFKQLREDGLVGPKVKGCELDGHPSAALRGKLRGAVDLSRRRPHRVTSIVVNRGATARGVRIGDRRRRVERAYPKAVFDTSVKGTFGITLVRIPESGGGRLQMAISAKTHRVTLFGVPGIPFCE
jgi:hypothetical protein